MSAGQVAMENEAEVRAAWAAAHVTPLWENRLAHAGPTPPEKGFIWKWSTLEPLARHATTLKDMAAIERRVLSLIRQIRGGALYQYFSVPRAVYQSLLCATSKGAYFNQNIRGRYRYEQMHDALDTTRPSRPLPI